tara:strand:- start:169 stop:438 length:270 start_codon:yes stop_codon:yes gene_type:complete
MARAYRSAAQWQALIEGQAASGLNVSDYCKQQDIAVSGFYTWKKKLAQAEPPTDDWIALPTSAADSPASWDMELSLPGGVVLRMRQSAC